MLLLDTCTLLWLTSSPESLSQEAKRLILQYHEDLFVSSICTFEIGVKSAKGLLELPLKLDRWFEASLSHHGISEIPVNSEIAIFSTQLPLLHRDPCDRMMIATAQINDWLLLSPDPLMRQYPKVKVVW